MFIPIYRQGGVIAQLKCGKDGVAVYSGTIMQEDKVTLAYPASAPLPIILGDYIIKGNVHYTLNALPEIVKTSRQAYAYTATFESPRYDLYNKNFMDEGDGTFSYTGNPARHLQLLLDNIHEIDAEWTLAEAPEMDEQTIEYDQLSCAEALTKIAEVFELEYYINNKEIHFLQKIGFDTMLQFEYGKGKGLYQLTRQNVSDANIATRVYAYGGTTNIPTAYRGGIGKLVFEERYLEKNVEIYGRREGYQTFENIYPRRTGTAESVGADHLSIVDTTLDFNLNDCKMEGVDWQIVFKSGSLSGSTFTITGYNDATKTITFAKLDDESYELPNDVRYPEPGDKYTLVGISMPATYVTAAETELKAALDAYMIAQTATPVVTYTLTLDRNYMQRQNISFRLGDRIRVIDTPLGVDATLRVSTLTFPLWDPYSVTITLADNVTYTQQEQLLAAVKNTGNTVTTIKKQQVLDARAAAKNWKIFKDSILDVDGYFDLERIRPNSIETGMLEVSTKASNFILNNCLFDFNPDADTTKIKIVSGSLVHLDLNIEGLGFEWLIDSATVENLDPDKKYWLYARCSKTELAGTWEVSEDQHAVEGETGYYWLLVGLLYASVEGVRGFECTYGQTTITGGTIKTGRIQDITGTNWDDLTTGQFWRGNTESSIDWNVTKPNTLSINGALVTKMVFAENADIQNLRVSSLRTKNPTADDPNPKRVEILEENNSIAFYDGIATDPVLKIDVLPSWAGGESTSTAAMRIMANNRTTIFSTEGIFSNAGAQAIYAGSTGMSTNASIVGYLFDRVSTPTSGDGISAAVAGVDASADDAGNAASYGGYFNSLYTGVPYLPLRRITASTTLLMSDVFIACYNTATINVMLPSGLTSRHKGKVIIVQRINSASVNIVSSGYLILAAPGARNTITLGTKNFHNVTSWSARLTWDGQYWLCGIEAALD